MHIYLKTVSEKAIGGYESDIIPRVGEWIDLDGKEHKVALVSHRVKKTLAGEYRLEVVDVTMNHPAAPAPDSTDGVKEPTYDQVILAKAKAKRNQELEDTKCQHCNSPLLWSEDRGTHCDGCDEYQEDSQ